MSKQKEIFSDLPTQHSPMKMRRDAQYKVWTENKAQLISRYLRYFVFITKHGAHIDGFAAPKEPENPSSWAAKLVVESEPKFLREFFLCDLDRVRGESLTNLVNAQPERPKRFFSVHFGDFNETVHDVLASGKIKDKTAAFCLIDQFTCQCQWSTVQSLARHKPDGANKIEIFYFLAVGWLQRSLPAFTRNLEIPELWWGRPDWQRLKGLNAVDLQLEFEDRFKKELGYKHVFSFPIHEREGEQGRHMITMIHASDHDEAPKLMQRAFRNVMKPLENLDDLQREFWERPRPE